MFISGKEQELAPMGSDLLIKQKRMGFTQICIPQIKTQITILLTRSSNQFQNQRILIFFSPQDLVFILIWSVTHSWDQNHRKFVIYELLFFTKCCLFYFLHDQKKGKLLQKVERTLFKDSWTFVNPAFLFFLNFDRPKILDFSGPKFSVFWVH